MRYMGNLVIAALGLAAATAMGQATDNCNDAPSVSGGTYSFDLFSCTNDFPGTCGGSGASADAWLRYTAPRAGTVNISTCGLASFDTVLEFVDTCGGFSLACNDDSCGLQSSLSLLVSDGQVVMIRIAGFNGLVGSGQVLVTDPIINQLADNCNDAASMTAGTIYTFDTSAATPDGFGSCGLSGSSNDVWAKFTAPEAGTYQFQTCGSLLDTVLAAFDGCGGSELGCNDDACGLQSALPIDMTAGQTVYLRVAGYNGLSGTGQVWVERFTGHAENPDAGELPAEAQVISGSGTLSAIVGTLESSGTDMFRIEICDPVNFTATMQAGFDTQLWIFNTDGTGVMFNDDTNGLLSALNNSGGQITAPGEYLIALSQYNRDAIDASGNLIWSNTPFTGIRSPDGPGAANAVAGWTGAPSGSGTYTIALTGACFIGGNQCATVDLNGDGAVDFNDYLEFLNLFNANDLRVDYNGDGVVDFNDYLEFLNRFNACS